MAFVQEQLRHDDLPNNLLMTLRVDGYKYSWLIPIPRKRKFMDSGETMVLHLCKPTFWEKLSGRLLKNGGMHYSKTIYTPTVDANFDYIEDRDAIIEFQFLDRNEILYDIMNRDPAIELGFEEGWFIFHCESCNYSYFRIMLKKRSDYIECRIDDEFERDEEHHDEEFLHICWKESQIREKLFLTSDSLKVRIPEDLS